MHRAIAETVRELLEPYLPCPDNSLARQAWVADLRSGEWAVSVGYDSDYPDHHSRHPILSLLLSCECVELWVKNDRGSWTCVRRFAYEHPLLLDQVLVATLERLDGKLTGVVTEGE